MVHLRFIDAQTGRLAEGDRGRGVDWGGWAKGPEAVYVHLEYRLTTEVTAVPQDNRFRHHSKLQRGNWQAPPFDCKSDQSHRHGRVLDFCLGTCLHGSTLPDILNRRVVLLYSE